MTSPAHLALESNDYGLIEADCSLIKQDGRVIGFSLVAQPQAKAVTFCDSMAEVLVIGKNGIKFEDGKITFINPSEGKVSFFIDDDDLLALEAIINGRNRLGLYNDGLLTAGFKLVLKGMKNDGEKTELTRIE